MGYGSIDSCHGDEPEIEAERAETQRLCDEWAADHCMDLDEGDDARDSGPAMKPEFLTNEDA